MTVIEATLNLMHTMTKEELLEMYHQARRIIDERTSPFSQSLQGTDSR